MNLRKQNNCAIEFFSFPAEVKCEKNPQRKILKLSLHKIQQNTIMRVMLKRVLVSLELFKTFPQNSRSFPGIPGEVSTMEHLVHLVRNPIADTTSQPSFIFCYDRHDSLETSCMKSDIFIPSKTVDFEKQRTWFSYVGQEY